MQSLVKSDLDQEVLVSILAPLNFFPENLLFSHQFVFTALRNKLEDKI